MKELKKYLFMPMGDYIVGIIAFVGIFLVVIPESYSDLSAWLLVFLVGGFFNIPLFGNALGLNAAIKKYEKSNQMDAVLRDFEHGMYLCNNAICLGEYVILGKWSSTITSYGEITKVYQHVTKKYGKAIRKKLCAQLKDKRTVTLCEFDKLDVNEEEMLLAIQIIQRKNPHIQIGYK